MRKLKLFIFVVLLASSLSSCILFIYSEGKVYIGYGWNSGILEINDSNLSVPQPPEMLVANQYYISEPGTYWASYKYSNTQSYVFNYTLTPDRAGFDENFYPYDAYFFIFLHQDGPTFYPVQYYDPATLKSISKSITLVDNSNLRNIDKNNLGEPSGVVESKNNGYRMTLRYWKIE
jgi:hypothetical protein